MAFNNLQGLVCHKTKPNQTINFSRCLLFLDILLFFTFQRKLKSGTILIKHCNRLIFYCFNGISTFLGYLMPNHSRRTGEVLFKPQLVGIRGFMPLPRGFIQKWTKEFELAYYDSVVKCCNHYTTGALPKSLVIANVNKFGWNVRLASFVLLLFLNFTITRFTTCKLNTASLC